MWTRALLLATTMLGVLLPGSPVWASGDTMDSGDGSEGPGSEFAQQNFFRDEYTVDVDPSSGAFQTSIPIKVPPFHGVEPALSLDYSSSAENGFVGVGWSLSGFSKIERITPGRGTPTYGVQDTYALDGQEMVAASSGNCSDLGGDYCTRIQNFKRIEQVGSNWVVTDKNGTKATYTPRIQPGGSTFRWNVSTVVDTHANTVNYLYACETATSDCYPDQIKYNGNKVVITFVRESRGSSGDADLVTFATGRDLRTIGKRLSEIRVSVDGSEARRYRLVYQETTNGERSKLQRIELRRGATAIFPNGTNPANQTFVYEDGPAIAWSRATYSHSTGMKLGYEYLTGDFNGDGLTDYFANPNGGNVTSVYTYLSDGDGTYTPDSRPISGTPYVNQTSTMGRGHWFTGDLNGDGRSDIVHALTGVMRIWYAIGSGGSFDWDVDEASWSCSCTVPIDFEQGRWSSGDFNGDGKTDLVQISRVSKKVYVWESNGTLSFDVVELDSGQPFVGGVGSLLPTDLNGDGNTDFVHIYNHSTTAGSVHWWLSNGDFTFVHDSMPRPGTYPVALNTGKWRAADFNGDGQADLFHASTGGNLHIWFSHGGDDFTAQQVSLPGSYPDTNSGWWLPVNLNGDGRSDLIHVTADATPTLELWQSTDAPGAFTHTSQGKPSGAPTYPGSTSNWTAGKWQLGDANGDGRDDLYHFSQHDPDNIQTWRDVGVDGNRLTDLTNRTGGTTSVAYTASSAWPRTGYLPVGMIYQTVTSVTTDDGRGNTHETRYEYENGLWSARERCFLGFGTIRKFLDSQDDHEDIRIHQIDNCTNRPEAIYKRRSDDRIFSYTQFEYDEEAATPPYRALEKRRNEHECNLNNTTGTGCRQVRTDRLYDQFGNVTRTKQYGLVAHGPSDPPDERTTFDSFFPNTSLYIVDRVARTRTYAGALDTAPAGNPASETRFVYDNPSGSYTNPPTKGDIRVRQDWDSVEGFRNTTFDYFTNGDLQQELDPLGRGKAYTYDPDLAVYPEDECPVPAVIPCTTTLWDAALGVPTSVTDPNGASTTHLYDTWGRLDLTTYDDSSFTDYVYSGEGDPPNQKVEIYESDHTADDLLRTVHVDGFGREWKTIREGGDTKTTEYHENSDRIEFESVWFNTGDGETLAEREYQYDGAKRLIKVIEPYTDPESPGNDVFSTIIYNVANDGSSTRTDALGKMRTTFVDGLGRTIRVREHDGAAVHDTEYRYDVLDQLTLVQDSLASQTQDATFDVDSLGKTRKACDFDIDQKLDESGCRTFTYYANGQLHTETNSRGQTTTFTYDDLGRIETKTTAEGELTTWFYDEPGHGASQGRLTRVVYPAGRQEFSWDALGFQTDVVHCVTTGSTTDCKSVSQTFVDRRLDTITYPKADGTTETFSYGYDDEGFVSSVSGLVSSMTHDARGRVTTITYATGGVSSVLNRDYPQDVLGDMAVTGPGGSIYQADYGYDAASQVKSLAGTMDDLTFLYDDLYRLTTVTGTGSSPSESFMYDRIGRLTTRDGMTYDYDHTAHPHAVSGADGKSYDYDADGNLTSVTTRSPECIVIDRLHQWDSESRLRWVSDGSSTTRYEYDHEGQRISKSGPNGTTRYYGGLLEVRDATSTTPILVRYYYVDGMLVAMDEGGSRQWMHTDHIDSVRAISDASTGQRLVAYRYAAYGAEIGTSGTSANVRSFGGHWRDDESALLYMGARYHDPALARFIQPDPVVPEPGDPQSWNRYSFVRNNPMNRIDPTGREDEEAQKERAETTESSVSEQWIVGGVPTSRGEPDLRPGDVSTLNRIGDVLFGPFTNGLIGLLGPDIEQAGTTHGVDPNLIRAVIYEQSAHLGPGEGTLELLGLGDTVGIGQINPAVWGSTTGMTRADLFSPWKSVDAIGAVIADIQSRGPIDPAAPITSIGTTYACGARCTSVRNDGPGARQGRRIYHYFKAFSSGNSP